MLSSTFEMDNYEEDDSFEAAQTYNMCSDIFNSTKARTYRLSMDEKRKIHHTIKSHVWVIDFIEALGSLRDSRKLTYNNYSDLFEHFSKIDLTGLIASQIRENQIVKCLLISGNQAWISASDSNHWRYFTKDSRGTTGLDLIDICEIIWGLSKTKTIEKLISVLGIHFLEGVWVQEQMKKYMANQSLIHNVKKKLQEDAPTLYKMVGPHLKLLETMNVLGNINIKRESFSYSGQNLFYASTTHISKFLGIYSVATVNKLVNLFAALGLVIKISEEHIPDTLRNLSIKIAEQRKLGNTISYFVIPPMADVLDEAEMRAVKLSEYGVNYSNICKEKITLSLGIDVAEKVYVQEVQKNKTRRASVSTGIVYDTIEQWILSAIERQGYVRKSELKKQKISGLLKKDLDCFVEKFWRFIIKKHGLRYIKPTSKMQAGLGLSSLEYIAVPPSFDEIQHQ